MDDDRSDTVLARLLNGVRITSALVPDQGPPRHVYRVVSPHDEILGEHETLNELIDRLDTYAADF